MTERTVDETAVAPLAGALPPHCQRDVETLRRFVHATVSHEPPADPICPSDFREVLLTGATGFVGCFVLRDLLEQNDELTVHCIVRAEDVEHGFERLRAALQQAEIWDEHYALRIRIVAGDVAEARFGLSESDFEAMCQRIDAVYHLAADINLSSSYLDIRTINTFSIRNVLELCLRKRFKYLFYASTMGVFPQYFCAFAHEFKHSRIDHQMQPDLASMKKMFPVALLGYPWSKLVSEQTLLFAQAAGLPVGIFRLPRTCTASTGPTQANDITVRLLAAVADVELMPQGFSIQGANEAVDVLSHMLTAISMNPKRRFTIYHCCDSQPTFYEIEPADFGMYWPEVPYASFKRACLARGEKSPLFGHWALVDHFAYYWFGNRRAAVLPICERAIREDCPNPIKWPSLLTLSKRSSAWIRRQLQWPHPVPESRLDFDCLTARAQYQADRVGVPFGSTYPEWLLSGLKHLVHALKAPDTRVLTEKLGDIVFEISRFLRNNAELARERLQHPEIEREEILRPIFIVGINRTGTTYLHRLMSRDKRFWTLRLYEYAEPVLSKDEYVTVAGTPDDPRRARVEEALQASEFSKAFEGIHDFNIDEPEEDFPIFRTAFSSWVSTVRFHIPEYGRWLAENGSGDVYAYHRRTIQHFTWQRRLLREPGHKGQWLLKMPFHLMELESMIETYPDALFIQTHREPSQFMGSWNSLVERVRSISTEPRPSHEIGAEQLAFMSGMLERALDFRLAHPELDERWIDVNYFDLVENPFGVIRTIYQHFGWTLDQAAVDAMEDWQFRQAERRRTERRHRYALEDYGLTTEAVNTAFARYRDFITSQGIRSL